MKSHRSLWAFSVLILAVAAVPAFAQDASGDFQFSSAGNTYAVSLSAHGKGISAGNMTFSGPAPVVTDEEGNTVAGPASLNVKANFDCLRVAGNRAVMTGVISESNIPGYVGRRATVTVEEGGNGAPSRFAYSFTAAETPNESPSDSELVADIGSALSWYATDSERPDDKAIPMYGKKRLENCNTVSSLAAIVEEMIDVNGAVKING